jgi:hypothetical protein
LEFFTSVIGNKISVSLLKQQSLVVNTIWA